ncbi:MAG: DUF4328 domain-containing protein [Acidimicrobiia bacterium]|nr:DUF4328 domain-containing protein [Acidimicrobiia bacterium]
MCPYCGVDPGGDRSDAPQPAQGGSRTDAAAGEFRQIRSIAVFLQLAFGLFILGTVVLMLTGWAYRNALLDMAAERPGALAPAARYENNYVAASAVLGGVNVFLVVAFMFWFWRSYVNLPVLGRPAKRSSGWAVGSWLIPFANFVLPYGIGAEIWKKSRAHDTLEEDNLEPVISWWALFLIMGLVNQVAFFTSRDVGGDIERMAAAVSVDLVGAAVSIAAALAGARFVRLATARQEELATVRGIELRF